MKETKDLILDAAFQLFLNNNYESVTFTELCKATQLTKGAVYHYFSSKEELFKAVIQKYVLMPHNKANPENLTLEALIEYKFEQIRQRIQKSIFCNVDTYNSVPMNYIQLLFLSYKYYPDFKKIGDTVIKEEINCWKKAIQLSIERKDIRSDIEIEIVSYNFVAILTNLLPRLIFSKSQDQCAIIKKQLDELYMLLKI